MTTEAANAAVDRLETDEDFASRVRDAGSPEASIEVLKSEGYDVTRGEMRDVTLDRFGDQLTEEQLEAIAAGSDSDDAALVVFGIISAGMAAAAAAV
jgi:predicted ribosomally synthesized peptide with nif11-like leader